MITKGMSNKLDNRIGLFSERATRLLSRRAVLHSALIGAVTSISAASLGKASAVTLTAPSCSSGVDCGPTYRCSRYTFCGGGSGGCPSNYHLCKSSGTCGPGGNANTQGYHCVYASGYWVACTGCHGSGSYKLCLDCVTNSGCTRYCGCRYWCTCVSPCIY